MATLSCPELLDWLEQNQFLTPEQVQPLRVLLVSFPDAHALARELIRRDWLTPYQINQILQGKHEQLLVDSYRLRERIGEGAMGQVFKASHPRLDRMLAIKMIHQGMTDRPKAMERFRREVETAGQLEHPNIAEVRDAGEYDGRPYLVMEYIEGFDLSHRVKQQGPLPIAEAVEYIRQAALGLQHAYERGIVHRDIKPGNLLVARSSDGRPVVKILDFGLARFASEPDESTRLTEVGKLLGTIDYIAPEQASDPRGADIRADIYSLGCSLFYLLAGRPPFLGDSVVEKLGPRMTGDAPWIRADRPEITPALEEVIRRMMARRPEDRYQTPVEVAQALAPFTGQPTPPQVPMAMPVSAPSPDVPMAHAVFADAPPPEPVSADPSFLGMTASGRDVSTGATAAQPATPRPARQGVPLKIFVILGASVLLMSLASCICMFSFWPGKTDPIKKSGTLRITEAKWSTGDKKLIPGSHHHVLLKIQRVDFRAPVKVWLRDLPEGVESTPLTLPPSVETGQVKVTVSYGTEPMTKTVTLYAECPQFGASAEMPMTLVVKQDPRK